MRNTPGTPTNTGHPLRSFRERNVRIFFGGMLLSHAGTWAQLTVVILLVRSLGGGGLELGIIAACQFVPLMLLGMYAGALADRIDRHKATMRLQAAMGVQAIALAAFDFAELESIPLLAAMSAIHGFLNAFDNPTRRTMITEMVPPEQLANVLSLSTSVMTGARVFGPAIGAILADQIGSAWVFAVNGLSYLVLLGAMASMDTSRFHPLARSPRSGSPIRDALREVWADPVLRITLVAFGLVTTFAYNTSVSVPLLVTDRLREDDALFGYLLSALSVGNVIGSLFVARLVVVSHRNMYAAGAFLAVSSVAFALVTSVPLAFALIVPLGMSLTMFVNSANVIVQQRTSPQIRSRVLALLAVIFLGSTPIGGPITGVIGDRFGAVWANAYGGVVAAVVVIGALAALRVAAGSFNPAESLQ